MNNANTISYKTTSNEQIDNAERQENTIGNCDDNENDNENGTHATIEATATANANDDTAVDLNNGPFVEES